MLRELAEGVYISTSYEGGNVGLVRTPRGAVLIDTPMRLQEARDWQLAIRGLGIESVYAIVNTDSHAERTHGNSAFPATRVIGHEASVKTVPRHDDPVSETGSAFHVSPGVALARQASSTHRTGPEISVVDLLTLHLGERRVDIYAIDGHTPASLGVYLPQERILFAGDNVTHNEHPTMAQANTLAWLETLNRLREMDIAAIVPGAGEPCGKEAIGPLYAYIAEMRQRVQELFEKGASRRECVEKVGMLELFPVPREQEQLIRRRRRESVERVYTELRMASRRRP